MCVFGTNFINVPYKGSIKRYDTATVINDIYAAKKRNSPVKRLNREKKWRPFAF